MWDVVSLNEWKNRKNTTSSLPLEVQNLIDCIVADIEVELEAEWETEVDSHVKKVKSIVLYFVEELDNLLDLTKKSYPDLEEREEYFKNNLGPFYEKVEWKIENEGFESKLIGIRQLLDKYTKGYSHNLHTDVKRYLPKSVRIGIINSFLDAIKNGSDLDKFANELRKEFIDIEDKVLTKLNREKYAWEFREKVELLCTNILEVINSDDQQMLLDFVVKLFIEVHKTVFPWNSDDDKEELKKELLIFIRSCKRIEIGFFPNQILKNVDLYFLEEN